MRLHPSRLPNLLTATAILMLILCASIGLSAEFKSGIPWKEPKVVDPGPPGGAPADAIVLFDGKDLSGFDGAERWEIKDGFAVCRSGATTKQAFGDCQLHVEWASPPEVKGHGQGRGNSGVYLMGQYELQILDSFDNKTYFDGQCGAIYKQSPPLANVCRKPGEWQTYDVIFRAPRFDADGKLLKPGAMTVLHNGVLVQNHFELLGKTAWREPPKYTAHPPKAPLHIQNHGNPVRFRNIWIRETPDRVTPKKDGQ